MLRSRRMRCAGNVACMSGRRGMYIGFWWVRDHCEDLDIGGRMMEKWDGFIWTGLI
jgi:hypothetical protein